MLSLSKYVCQDLENSIYEYLLRKKKWFDADAVLRSHEPLFIHRLNSRPELFSSTTGTWNLACQLGNLNVVKWLHQTQKEGCTTDAMDWAAAGGHLNVVIWLHENRPEGCTAQALSQAIRRNHLNMAQWLHRVRKQPGDSDSMVFAVQSRSIIMVAWVYYEMRTESGTYFSKGSAMEFAAENGDLDIVQFLHENQIDTEWKPHSIAIDIARKRGHSHIVDFLKTKTFDCRDVFSFL